MNRRMWIRTSVGVGRARENLLDRKRWLAAKPDFLMPAKPLAMIFKDKFRDALKKAGLFESVLKSVWKKDWVIDIEPVGNGEAAVKYLAPYIFRVAISNRNILSMKEGQVTFRNKDSETREVQFRTLPADRFIALFLQHVLPRGFIKVRYFGFYASTKKHLLAIVKELLLIRLAKEEKPAKGFKCPYCDKENFPVGFGKKLVIS